MNGKIPSVNEWSDLQSCWDDVPTITERANEVIGCLKTLFEGDQNDGMTGVSFNVSEASGSVVGTMSSPIGCGRFVLGWAMKEDALIGRLRFERAAQDSHGDRVWESCWSLDVPAAGRITGKLDEGEFGFTTRSGNQQAVSNAIFALGMASLYSLLGDAS